MGGIQNGDSHTHFSMVVVIFKTVSWSLFFLKKCLSVSDAYVSIHEVPVGDYWSLFAPPV